jgi:hypothetical protein
MRAEPEEFDRVEGRKTFASLIAGERPVYARRTPSKARRVTARPLGRNARRRRT